ncbi:MAG: NTP transferase domain-containing protein [Ignavibacteriales bacterium]|nr:NTP transferase domain-containing protein [Ignavibacteriales bacterium]
MKAVIMSGGFGTRLRPLTCNIPKPMVPMMNKPMMQHIVELIKKLGINQIVSTLFYQPEIITGYFGDGTKFDVHMQYRKAEADYGTAGSVRNAADFLDERFIIISGDVLTDFDLSKAIEFHEKKKAKATVVLTRATNPLAFGVVITDNNGKITRFLEKPTWGEVFSDTINTGIYIIEPDVLQLVPYQKEFDFSKNLFPALLEQDMGLYGYIAEGYWRDVGNLNEYQEAHLDALDDKVKLTAEGNRVGSAFVGSNTMIETAIENLQGKVLIGKNCKIGKNVKIFKSVIGNDCVIEDGALIRNSVVWSDTKIGKGAELTSCVIGKWGTIGDYATISDNVFISDKCIIGNESKLAPNIKLWPEKEVEDGAILTRSLVWEDKWLKDLFTDARITGLSNIEMNPEFGAKIGAAFGALTGKGKTILMSRDSDNVSRMMNRAIMCGLMSAGVDAGDLRAVSIPILRQELRTGKHAGGIHVRKSPFDKSLTDIIFFDAKGKDLPSGKTKSLERLFFGEDFPRVKQDEVGGVTFPERAQESYIEKFLSTINVDAISQAKFKLVIDYSSGIASTIFPNIIGSLHAHVLSQNAYLDAKKLTRNAEEYDAAVDQLSHIVTSLGYDVGFLMDAGAEKCFVVDENGKFINNDRLLTLVTYLFLSAYPEVKKVAVPVTASAEIDLIAEHMGVEVVKTRDSHLSLIEAATREDIKFVGGTRGGFIFTDFLFASDGMYSVAKILEMMALTNTRFGKLDQQVPKLHMNKKMVHVPWDKKGKVMRYLMKETDNQPQRILLDGVKLVLDQKASTSVLLWPDRAKPTFHLHAESAEKELADMLVAQYEEKIVEWRDTRD